MKTALEKSFEMSGENKSGGSFRVWKIVIVAVLAMFAVGFIMPVVTRPAKRGLLTENLMYAHYVVGGLVRYAWGHDDQFPQSLEELVPKYCTNNAVLLNTVADGKTKVPWLYFPGHKFEKESQVVVLTSQPDSQGNRVVGYSDGTAEIIWQPVQTHTAH